MSKDKDQKESKTSVPKVTHVRIGESKKKKPKSFIDFAIEYSKKTKDKEPSEQKEEEPVETKVEEVVPEFEIDEKPNFEVPSVSKSKKSPEKESKEIEAEPQETSEDVVVKKDKDVEKKEKPTKPKEEGFFPRFLRKQNEPSTNQVKPEKETVAAKQLKEDGVEEVKEVKYLTTEDEKSKGTLHTEPATNLNSFSSIFNRDSSSIAGVRRVFKKSMGMMVISFVLFAFLTFLSLHLFSVNLLWIILLQVLFVTVTNIFYIVVADRSYVWIGLMLQALVFIAAQASIGQLLSIPTGLGLMIIIFLVYLGYTDVEKTQLSSRLFSIGHITSDSVRMLNTAVSFVLALGMFNSIVSLTSAGFIREELFENQFVVDNVIIGEAFPGLNRLLLNNTKNFQNADEIIQAGNLAEEDADSNINFYTFLRYNYNLLDGKPILTDSEIADMRLDSSINLVEEQKRVMRERAENFRQEVYGKLPYTLDTVLDKEKYEQVTEETYVYIVNKFIAGSNDSLSDIALPLIPRDMILPAALAVFVFLVSLAANFILGYIINIFMAMCWFVLRKLGFARVDVENVEAEVVTI